MKKGTSEAGCFPHSSRLCRTKRAFSLVEVAMALGILSFALTAIVGLAAVGMNGLRQNIDRTVEAQIMGWAARKAQTLREVGPEISGPVGTYGFDAAGMPLESPEDPARIYSATLVSENKSLPGSGQGLWTVNVAIRAKARGDQLLGSHALWFSK